MTAWRIVQRERAAGAFDGEGARLYPGRWNHRGIPMVYTASTVSLATLEVLVHVETAAALARYVCIPVEVEDHLCRTAEDYGLPEDWAADPAPFSTRDLGSGWARGGDSLALAVPSAVIPSEMNVLINPGHPDFARLKIGSPRDLYFDPRLLRHRG